MTATTTTAPLITTLQAEGCRTSMDTLRTLTVEQLTTLLAQVRAKAAGGAPSKPAAPTKPTTPAVTDDNPLIATLQAEGCKTSIETLRTMSTEQLTGLLYQVRAKAGKPTGEPTTEAKPAPKAKPSAANAEYNRATSKGNEQLAVDGGKANTPPATTVQYTTLATATVVQLVEQLVSRITTEQEMEVVVDMVDVALKAKLTAILAPNATAQVPAMAAKAEAPSAVLVPKATKPTCTATKADGTPCKGTALIADTGKCNTHQTKAKATKAENEGKGKTPAPLPVAATVPAKGTILVADGNGGSRAATVEEVHAALEAMTAPAAKPAA